MSAVVSDTEYQPASLGAYGGCTIIRERLQRTVDDKDLTGVALEDGISEVVEAACCAQGRVLAKVSAQDGV
jgi:hypothetical protein